MCHRFYGTQSNSLDKLTKKKENSCRHYKSSTTKLFQCYTLSFQHPKKKKRKLTTQCVKIKHANETIQYNWLVVIMMIDVSEQSKFFKQEGCATTDNMFRMAFHAQKYIPLIQIIVKLALGFSDCNRFN
jgi:hypothetical protein